MTYLQKLTARLEGRPVGLCVGLDPRPQHHGGTVAGVEKFVREVIEQTAPFAAVFKPNAAYFEALGAEGYRLLEQLRDWIPEEVPLLLDAKRGDIGETQRYYAQACFERCRADAVTLSPYLGYETLEPFLDWSGKGIYLLALTSNPGSADLQRQSLAQRPLYAEVASWSQRAVEEKRSSSLGLVVGLTQAGEEELANIPDAPLLLPGLGAQGGDLTPLLAQSRSAPVLVNVSRGILYQGDEGHWGARAEQWAQRLSAK